MSDIPIKKCQNPNCSKINPQPITEFGKSKGNKDGLYYRCKTCVSFHNAQYHQEHREERKQYHKEYAQTETGKIMGKRGRKKYRQTEKGKIAHNKFANSDKGKISRAKGDRKYKETPEGKAVKCAIQAQYRAAKLQATPKWVTKEQKLEMKMIYIKCARLTKETGIVHNVDHIFPLQAENELGERVGSGLHVPWNLRIVTASQNSSDGPKLINKP